MEFHVSRISRDRYHFDDALFTLTGNVVIADFYAARVFAQRMNETGRHASASEINAMGLIDEVSHMLVAEYRRTVDPDAMAHALAALNTGLGVEAVDAMLERFVEEFPTVDVYRGRQTVREYMNSRTDEAPNREVLLEEMLLLWLANANPAFARYDEFFADRSLQERTAYQRAIAGLAVYFEARPPFLEGQNLIAVLRAPALAHPDSLLDQLRYIETRFMSGVPGLKRYLVRARTGRDFIQEEARSLAAYFGGGFGGFGGFGAPEFSASDIRSTVRAGGGVYGDDTSRHDPEYEAYTQDRAWMPRLVLIAKNIYVWLAQLSAQYGRDISRLDQLPDEELDKLRSWGVTGIWLIGVWERSRASRRIKQMMGAEDAVASAYSLMDYCVAEDLGGESAMQNLRERAWRRGIRMGSDMVPNHFGIDSTWVIHHPERFLSLDHPPYPGYTFNGPDLSEDPGVGVFLEDHYYTRADAAVVFKRLDRRTGEVKYIYHGNDGTSMPWNDTAQLNYLKADVREAVIQTILQVCRQFPIVRFDAAMTLAKRHVQRLWFPQPGSGDGIPSRAGMGMSREEFDRWMPQEFWREVVDRAAVEAPDTLLLAEAFWMLEGYFVRTLGMHRVYNSAFMHMLRDEDNAKYRYLIRETLEFDPQILKRYVNFMNNPDEKSAVEQFGKDDKYFGIAVLLSTLPGLPMFGHGQMEGYVEKYGMEFRRPKLHETPNQGLIDHHARVIFPLLHRRHVFAEVEDFRLYDFQHADGDTDENVFAYSNRSGDECALVLVHNKLAHTRGYVRNSVAFLVKGVGMQSTTLSEALSLHADDRHFLRFRDHVSGLEFLRRSSEICEHGLYVELSAYQSHVFVDVREVFDGDGRLARLHGELGGRGTADIDELLHEYEHERVREASRVVLNADTLRWLLNSRLRLQSLRRSRAAVVDASLLDALTVRVRPLLQEAGVAEVETAAYQVREDVATLMQLETFDARRRSSTVGRLLDDSVQSWLPVLVWALLRRLERAEARLDEWDLRRVFRDACAGLGLDAGESMYAESALRVLLAHAGLLLPAHALAVERAAALRRFVRREMPAIDEGEREERLAAMAAGLLADAQVRRHVGAHEWQGVEYFNREAFELLVRQLAAVEVVMLERLEPALSKAAVARLASMVRADADALITRAADAGWRVIRMIG
ncbi:MAG: alpha-amylase family glycosyl hydrolase [Chloroflexi bacterium]|nr:alpha-amylase family glycosyl hydrolase [Chloroflexota bacterium]